MNEVIESLEKDNNFFVFHFLERQYQGNFNRRDFKMFEKYGVFYDIPHRVCMSLFIMECGIIWLVQG